MVAILATQDYLNEDHCRCQGIALAKLLLFELCFIERLDYSDEVTILIRKNDKETKSQAFKG